MAKLTTTQVMGSVPFQYDARWDISVLRSPGLSSLTTGLFTADALGVTGLPVPKGSSIELLIKGAEVYLPGEYLHGGGPLVITLNERIDSMKKQLGYDLMELAKNGGPINDYSFDLQIFMMDQSMTKYTGSWTIKYLYLEEMEIGELAQNGLTIQTVAYTCRFSDFTFSS